MNNLPHPTYEATHPFVLTDENYYSNEADREYLSCSQIDAFEACEAAAYAKLQGRYTPPSSKAFIVGNYFHTAFESEEAREAFLIANEEHIFGRGGKKYADFTQADKMIEVALNDPAIKKLIDMPGDNEVIMTGKLFDDFLFKVRFDKYIPNEHRNMIIDWKTVANIWETKWSDFHGKKVTFVDMFGYMMRAAVYTEIERQNSGRDLRAIFNLVCISKQDPPDKEIINMNNDQEMNLELERLYIKLNRIVSIKRGEVKPVRCGHCAYCRGTKKINRVLEAYQLEPGFRPEREDDYAI